MSDSNLIAGNKIPKWDVNDPDDLNAILHNIENKSETSEKFARLEKAKQARAMVGVCERCRCTNCLCREGQ